MICIDQSHHLNSHDETEKVRQNGVVTKDAWTAAQNDCAENARAAFDGRREDHFSALFNLAAVEV